MSEPPRGVWYTRNEARLLLADLDEARRTLLDSGHLPWFCSWKSRLACSVVVSVSRSQGEILMSDEPLDLTQAARRLGITTREIVVLVDEGKIRYVIHRGMVHILPEALDEYRKAS